MIHLTPAQLAILPRFPFCPITSFSPFLSSQNLPSAPGICSLPETSISPSAVIPGLLSSEKDGELNKALKPQVSVFYSMRTYIWNFPEQHPFQICYPVISMNAFAFNRPQGICRFSLQKMVFTKITMIYSPINFLN